MTASIKKSFSDLPASAIDRAGDGTLSAEEVIAKIAFETGVHQEADSQKMLSGSKKISKKTVVRNKAKENAKTAAAPRSAAEKLGAKLARLGLRSDQELVLHLPIRYEDETTLVSIAEAGFMFNRPAQVEGVVTTCSVQFRPRRQLVVTIVDDSGPLILRFLNFYGSQTRQLAEGTRLRVRGEVRHGFLGPEIVHPAYKVVLPDAPFPTVLTPVYPSGEGVSQNVLRKAIAAALGRVVWTDTLPPAIMEDLQLAPFEDSIRLLHNPPQEVDQAALIERTHPAWTRMKFDELLAQQLSLKRAQRARRAKISAPLSTIGRLSQEFLACLPFSLTAAQQRVLQEVRGDLQQSFPMLRLLQGDVGCGKTIVAALAAAQAIDSGYQAALMAPTEILAEQHFHKIAAWMVPLGIDVVWLTGSMKKKAKAESLSMIESGKAQLVIGTHALIQEAVSFARLGLVIVDEQHRFGVGQRLALRNKGKAEIDRNADDNERAGAVPHQLMMSATPIPRTLAMTYYADLEVSIIDELPPGRTPIVTRVIDQTRREEVVRRVHAAAIDGRQVYWVCPLIEESEALQLQTATDTHATLVEALPDLRIGLVHGRMKAPEKQAVMEAFTRGDIHALVATTVIEVGVDVPNATLMVIEHAERFGLSQLHQLRGRVGRGASASICLLLYQSPLGMIARQRLRTMRETTDGFEIARRDLQIRGPGEFLGARQSGQALLRFANLETDQWLVEAARNLATVLLKDDPRTVQLHLARWLGAREEFLKA